MPKARTVRTQKPRRRGEPVTSIANERAITLHFEIDGYRVPGFVIRTTGYTPPTLLERLLLGLGHAAEQAHLERVKAEARFMRYVMEGRHGERGFNLVRDYRRPAVYWWHPVTGECYDLLGGADHEGRVVFDDHLPEP